MELPLLAVAHDRVSGVVASLEAHDRVDLLGEQVGDLALALIAPLGADDHYSGHRAQSRRVRVRPGERWALRPLLGAELAPLVLAEQRQQVTADLDEARDRASAERLGELVGHEVRRRDDRALGL